jgi:mono/diheme cytochrome c family protein
MDRRSNLLSVVGITIAIAVSTAGCGESDSPPFRLNMKKVVSNQLVPEHQKAVANILEAMFGTPDKPFVLPETGLDIRKLRMAAGPVWSDEAGTEHGLYRRHCAHCHGISGDGQGPTAAILDPYPRDYREGVFKFKSTYNPDQPTDEDLHHTLLNGIPGTAMPAFSVLAPAEVDALVEYVKYLSMRGQMETALINYIMDEISFDPVTGEAEPLDPVHNEGQRTDIMSLLVDDVVPGWQEASDEVVVPEESGLPEKERSPAEIAASAAKGRELFYGTKANCVKCHGPTGLGDGQQDDFDNWNKANKEFLDRTTGLADSIKTLQQRAREVEGDQKESADQELQAAYKELQERDVVADHLLPVRNAIPRNLRTGMYRGGRRPLDLYRRVHQGIAGTPMPAAGPASPGAQGTLTEEEIWQIVDYVRSLPFEPASRPQLGTARVNTEAIVN